MVWRPCAGWWICLASNWQASQDLTSSVVSSRVVGQYKPDKNALPVSVHEEE